MLEKKITAGSSGFCNGNKLDLPRAATAHRTAASAPCTARTAATGSTPGVVPRYQQSGKQAA